MKNVKFHVIKGKFPTMSGSFVMKVCSLVFSEAKEFHRQKFNLPPCSTFLSMLCIYASVKFCQLGYKMSSPQQQQQLCISIRWISSVIVCWVHIWSGGTECMFVLCGLLQPSHHPLSSPIMSHSVSVTGMSGEERRQLWCSVKRFTSKFCAAGLAEEGDYCNWGL